MIEHFPDINYFDDTDQKTYEKYRNCFIHI